MDLLPGCGTIELVRWLIAPVLFLAIAGPADAGVFKARGGAKPAAAPTKKAEKPATAKKAKAAAAPAKKSPAKKSAVAATGRPSKKKSVKESDVTITVEDEDDVIIRDIDD